MEIWREIPETFSCYSVSNLGNVRNNRSGKVLKQKDSFGYKRVCLSVNGRRQYRSVHRLVASVFIENPENKPTVNHINEIKSDNRVENLEWATYLEQNVHGTRIERAKEHTDYKTRNIDYSAIASKHNYRAMGQKFSKPVSRFDLNGNLISSYKSIREASMATKTNAGHLCECLNNKRKTAGGYVWRYTN